MASLFSIIGDINAACVAGRELTNANTWANRASLAAAFTAILTAALPIANYALGLHLEATGTDVASIGQGLATALIILGVNRVHIAANPRAGKLPAESDARTE